MATVNPQTPAVAPIASPARWADLEDEFPETQVAQTPVSQVSHPTTQYMNQNEIRTRLQNLERTRQLASERTRWWQHQNLYYSGSDPSIPYVNWSDQQRRMVKWGQLKLLLSELQLLVYFWDPAAVPNPIIVYAGAAPGTHLHPLFELFPGLEWHLYDPRDFNVPEGATVHKELFTDDIARSWAASRDRVIFISDIRSTSHTTASTEENEEGISRDMESQMRWHQLINPYLSLLKFRLPYYQPQKPQFYPYLYGHLLYQAFNGPDSSEMRLVPLRDHRGQYYTVDYDIKEYEERLFYHNAVVRQSYRYYTTNIGPGKSLVPQQQQTVQVQEVQKKFLGCHDTLHLLTVTGDFLRSIGKVEQDRNLPLALAYLLIELLNQNTKKKRRLEDLVC